LNIIHGIMETALELYYLFLSVSGGGSFPRKLTASEELQYISLMQRGDKSARAKLIEHNLRLVAHISKKYYQNQSDGEDMLSVGTIGLIKAVDTFTPDRGTRFSSYAARCIENECLMHLRAAKKTAQDVSISEPIDYDKHGNELTLLDVISSEDTIADDLDIKLKCERLRDILQDTLQGRELSIICMRYGLCGYTQLTQKDIADKLGISRSYVSRIEKKAVERLRERF